MKSVRSAAAVVAAGVAASAAILGTAGAAHAEPYHPCTRTAVIDDVSLAEGDPLRGTPLYTTFRFTVTAEGCVVRSASLMYSILAYTTNTEDLTAVTGTLSWGIGDGSSRYVDVPVRKDFDAESDERFGVLLCPGTGISYETLGRGTILNDDAAGFPSAPTDPNFVCKP